MKTLTTLIVAIMSASLVYGQHPLRLVKERVGNPDILKNWNVGDIKTANQVSITRQEGENDYDFITNVFYTPKSTIMNLLDEKAKAEALLPAAREKMIQTYAEAAPGGQIALFYCRPEEKLAETINFSVRVIDENDNAVWTSSLEKEQPYYYKWEIWYFYKTINVPVTVGQNFTIQVCDASSKKSYKFKVSQNEDTKERQPDLSLRSIHF